jgi:ABC-2 type transport system ATP-binding protein
MANEREAVVVRALEKKYGDVEAVRGVDITVQQGEIFGLIGPDGAGKTSVFQILGGVMQATSGTAEMFGVTAREARSFTGYLTQTFSLYQDLSVEENIRYVGELRRVSGRDIRERGMRYLQMFGMERFTDRLAGRLSGGMKQKLALACALVAEPKILLLDEPTTGVDPVSRREFWDTLAQLATAGMTIVVATPYLDEAERCHRVSLMHEGVIRQTGTPAELRGSLGLHRIELRTPDLAKSEAALAHTEGIHDVQRFGDRLDVMVADAAAGEALVRDRVGGAGVAVDSLRASHPTLENTFVSLLRTLGNEIPQADFPARHARQTRRGDVAIGARGLSKRFGAFHAVKDVDIEVRYGEIYGLLGANGAGKTTTIKMLCGLTQPSSGETELAGERGYLRSGKVRQQIGYMSQKFSLYDDLSVGENLDYFAGVYSVPDGEREEKKDWVLRFSGLQGKGDRVTGSLPGGWKQRVAFGAAILHEPAVLFLDEPTSGVDPLARRAFWRMINDLADRGAAILVTTHYLEEAEQCNRLGFMVAGELVAQGSPTAIKAEQEGHLVELQVDRVDKALDLLKQRMERWRVSLFGDRIHVISDEPADKSIRDLTEMLAADGLQVNWAAEREYSLEDVFLVVVEKARREGKVAVED